MFKAKHVLIALLLVAVICVGAVANNFAEYKSMRDLEDADMPTFVLEAGLPSTTRIERDRNPEDRTMWKVAYLSWCGPQISYYDTLEQVVDALGE